MARNRTTGAGAAGAPPASTPDSLHQLRRSPVGTLYESMLSSLIQLPGGQRRAFSFFVYSQDFLPVPANGTLTRDIAIQADSDFLVFAGVATSRDPASAGAPDADLRATVRITSSGSGREWFDRTQDADNIFGTAQRPAWWPVPYIAHRNSTLRLTISDLRGRDTDFRAALWGFKLFDSAMGAR